MASIVPSILAGDFARLGGSLDAVKALGLSAIHIDVIDGHFRPEISVGQPVVRSIRKATQLDLDVHLMIERPERYIESFVSAGADYLAFHPESTQDVTAGIAAATKLGTKVGLALALATPLEACYEVLDLLDFVLIQSSAFIEGKEEFVPRSISRVASTVEERKARGLSFAIEVEGGIGVPEAEKLLSAGADILVVGSAIFDKQDGSEGIRELARKLGREALPIRHELQSRTH